MEIPADARPIDALVPEDLVEAFVVATTTTFEELAATIVVPRDPFMLDRALPLETVASLTLQHEPPGELLLGFPRTVLESLARRYIGDATTITDELIDDAAGEFANVIAGQAKTMLKGMASHYRLSTPVVTRTARESKSSFLTLVFDCEAGSFVLQVAGIWLVA